MLDIKFIRDHKDLIKDAARKKHINFNVDELVEADDRRRELLTSIEKLRSAQNVASEKVGRGAGGGERAAIIAEMRSLKENLQKKEEEFRAVIASWQSLMLRVPNVPDISVPDGVDDSANIEVRSWGTPPQFEWKPLSHVDLLERNGMADFSQGAEVSGFRGYFLTRDGARLSFALWQFALAFYTKRCPDYELMMVPSLVRKETLLGTGYLPQGADDLYVTQDGSYLAGTGEVGTMAYFSNAVFPKDLLPKKVLAFSPCFRREAGSHGKDTKGLMRVHEFFKFEQVIISEASHEISVKFHEEINRHVEELVEELGVPYRTVVNCGGDLGLGQVKKYDVELWVPSEGRYREISSASYFHDFQTRRLNIRYKEGEEKARFAHSLNSTALPTPRLLIALVENNQRADGSIHVPEALQPYVGKSVIGG